MKVLVILLQVSLPRRGAVPHLHHHFQDPLQHRLPSHLPGNRQPFRILFSVLTVLSKIILIKSSNKGPSYILLFSQSRPALLATLWWWWSSWWGSTWRAPPTSTLSTSPWPTSWCVSVRQSMGGGRTSLMYVGCSSVGPCDSSLHLHGQLDIWRGPL